MLDVFVATFIESLKFAVSEICIILRLAEALSEAIENEISFYTQLNSALISKYLLSSLVSPYSISVGTIYKNLNNLYVILSMSIILHFTNYPKGFSEILHKVRFKQINKSKLFNNLNK
jgi:DNA polymerase III alpha subunit (gram-positive type)